MRYFVKVKPRAHVEHVERIDATNFVISVREPPDKGLANLAVRRALAEALSVSQSSLKLVAGFSSSRKVFTLLV